VRYRTHIPACIASVVCPPTCRHHASAVALLSSHRRLDENSASVLRFPAGVTPYRAVGDFESLMVPPNSGTFGSPNLDQGPSHHKRTLRSQSCKPQSSDDAWEQPYQVHCTTAFPALLQSFPPRPLPGCLLSYHRYHLRLESNNKFPVRMH
jgi:hypothetical protein